MSDFFLARNILEIVLGGLVALAALMMVSTRIDRSVRAAVEFLWAFFLKLLFARTHEHRGQNQQQAMELIYGNEAHVYEATRRLLLKGREECLQLAVAHLPKPVRRLVWVDIGGGTGSNIEMMHHILPLDKHFAAVYLVDLSTSLCAVARQRFAGKSWARNVVVLEADACDFTIDRAHVDLITFSYSLLMIPMFNSVVDRAQALLEKTSGIIACVDFGIQSTETCVGRANTVGGQVNRNMPWLLRNFWRIWFEAGKVYLDSARRNYLEHKFGTLKSFNAYNSALGMIPYYVWVGCDKDRSRSLLHRINCLATESPYLAPADDARCMDDTYLLDNIRGNKTQCDIPVSKGHEVALSNIRRNLPFPSIYYQKNPWRVYFSEFNPMYRQFRNQYIYAFTWEDPREDHDILNFSSKDTVLAITSAGDNILAYACLPEPPAKIHAVDMNPYQNHLLELKLAAFKSLTQDQIWKMFGEGRINGFRNLLVNRLSAEMSSDAFQYWMDKGDKTFDPNTRGLYDTGSTRWALRLARATFSLFGLSSYIDEVCSCTNMKDQIRLWETKLKPLFFNPFIATILVGNPIFMWKALGVPANQVEMFGDSVLKYVIDTIEPLAYRSLISTDNYFYYLCLKGNYARNNCPAYLTEKGYRNLTIKRTDGKMSIDNIRIHTDTVNDVFARLNPKSITIAIIMDQMDWLQPKLEDAKNEILAIHKCLVVGGRVMLRSAAQHPWYIKTFEQCGFKCKPAGIRHSGQSIDRINMYTSTWVCTKQDDARASRPRRRMSSLKI